MTVEGTEQRVYGTLTGSYNIYISFRHNGGATYCDNPACANNPPNTYYSSGMRVARFTRKVSLLAFRYGGDLLYLFEDGGGNTWDAGFEFKVDKNKLKIWVYTAYNHDFYNSAELMIGNTPNSYVTVTAGSHTMLPNPYYEEAIISKYAIPKDLLPQVSHYINLSELLE